MVENSENEVEIRERDPNYFKKAQWFGLAAIGLLCLTLILSVFMGGGKRRSREQKPLPIDQAQPRPAEGDTSQQDLQERIRQERLRRKRQPNAEPAGTQDPQERMQALVERREGQERREQQAEEPPAERPSVEDEFRRQEIRRALMARRSKFGLRGQGAMQSKLVPASARAMDSEGLQSKDSPLLAEQQRIKQEIQRLEDMQRQGPQVPDSFVPSQAEGQGAGRDPREQLTVGRPAGEARPEPGQRLIPTGTVISAVLDQKLISDYTGPFRAMVTHDVYDVTGNYIIIPKGSRVTGSSLRISNVNGPIQARMGLAVKWLVLPDGKRISFERRVAALDQEGVPAVKDKVNYHFMAQFLGVMAYAVLSSETSREGSGYANDQTYEGELGRSVREQFAPLAAKYLNLVPTITLRIGTPMKIFLEDDVYAYPWASLGQKLYQANRAVD